VLKSNDTPLEHIFVYWPLLLLPKHFSIIFRRSIEKIENVKCCQSYSLHLKMQNLINMNNFPEIPWDLQVHLWDMEVSPQIWRLISKPWDLAVLPCNWSPFINDKFGASIEYKSNCVPIHTDYTIVKHKMSFQNTGFSPVMQNFTGVNNSI
jgi:hypothetical protein